MKVLCFFVSFLPFTVSRVLGILLHSSSRVLKPKLSLSFEALVTVDHSIGNTRPNRFEQHVAMDEGHYMVAVVPFNDTRHSMVVDAKNGIRTNSLGFFSENVCFTFDLEVNHQSQKQRPFSDQEAALAFEHMTERALYVPVSLYAVAKEHAEQQQSNGHQCDIWRFHQTQEEPIMNMSSELGNFTQFAMSLNALEGQTGPELMGKHSIVKFDIAASFCVNRSGLLHSFNSIAHAHLRDSSSNRSLLLFSEETNVSLQTIHPVTKSTEAFSPELRATGGRCVNLTSGAARARELERNINDHVRLAQINTEAGGAWMATSHSLWHDSSLADVVQLLGTEIQPLQLSLRHSAQYCSPFDVACQSSFRMPAAPPEHFDARTEWPQCPSIREVFNQGPCGSCWAIAASTVLADRFCISANSSNVSWVQAEHQHLQLSTQYMLDCDTAGKGCSGGMLDDAWKFLQTHGLPEEACDPYAYCPKPRSADCGGKVTHLLAEPRKCPTQCHDSRRDELLFNTERKSRVFRAGPIYAVSAPGDVLSMQQEMMQHGPFEAGFFVFSDFYSYKNGTYFRTPSAAGPFGGHAVRLVGWGVDRHNTDYWVVANSFGIGWGMHGFFHIRRGTNECGIETTPAAGIPVLEQGKTTAPAL